ncbi:MAG: hypothetical protein JSS53_01030, partial [Proteobacteria bacterium]|nr:hypothetical protein [Pseudomonadota bacterium]
QETDGVETHRQQPLFPGVKGVKELIFKPLGDSKHSVDWMLYCCMMIVLGSSSEFKKAISHDDHQKYGDELHKLLLNVLSLQVKHPDGSVLGKIQQPVENSSCNPNL